MLVINLTNTSIPNETAFADTVAAMSAVESPDCAPVETNGVKCTAGRPVT